MTQPVDIAVAGLGTVGAGVVKLIQTNGALIARRGGRPLRVVAVAARDRAKDRGVDLAGVAWYDDASRMAREAKCDVVVELIGGADGIARATVEAALDAGRHVVTANKALIAKHGNEIFAKAREKGLMVAFEAAVAGGIPIIKAIREGLAGNTVEWVAGIINGTCNFILTEMREKGRDFDDVLAEAQALGYAEADPTFDVEGVDAAHKLTILASIAFGVSISDGEVDCEGIASVTARDIAFAARHGFVLKLLAMAERHEVEGVPWQSVRVHPTLVPIDHPLAAVRGSFNAVFVHGDAVGDLMFYGPGAGGAPTASAVLGDVVDAAINLRRRTHASVGMLAPARVLDPDELVDAWYIGLEVDDRPGVLAAIAAVLGERGVSIASMDQDVRDPAARTAEIDLVLHPARTADVRATLAVLADLDPVRSIDATVRVLPGAIAT